MLLTTQRLTASGLSIDNFRLVLLQVSIRGVLR